MSGAWRNAYLTIAMLKVDISRRHEVAVKMKELDKSGHKIKAFQGLRQCRYKSSRI
jgi:hypothetical protein